MSRQYNEQFMEDFIKNHPLEFLGENLTLISQQAPLSGYRTDLVFEDEGGVPLIVEVQQETLDRAHLYRALEYRDLMRTNQGGDPVRVMLVCNEIRDKHRGLLNIHDVECVVISREDFISKATQLCPTLVIELERDAVLEQDRLSCQDIMDRLARDPEPTQNTLGFDAVVFWTTRQDSSVDGRYLMNLDLRKESIQKPLFSSTVFTTHTHTHTNASKWVWARWRFLARPSAQSNT